MEAIEEKAFTILTNATESVLADTATPKNFTDKEYFLTTPPAHYRFIRFFTHKRSRVEEYFWIF